jgi:hypothetical protein
MYRGKIFFVGGEMSRLEIEVIKTFKRKKNKVPTTKDIFLLNVVIAPTVSLRNVKEKNVLCCRNITLFDFEV